MPNIHYRFGVCHLWQFCLQNARPRAVAVLLCYVLQPLVKQFIQNLLSYFSVTVK